MPFLAHRARRSTAVAAAALVLVAGCSSDGERADRVAPADAAEVPVDSEADRVADLSDLELATEAYVAGYPLLVSTRTMQQLGGLLGVNSLLWQRELSGPQSRLVVAPNRDTLYSVAVLDLRSEPQVLTLPEVTDRYFTYQFLDAWTESFAYVGTRATDGRAGTWVIVAPGWDGELPEGVEVIEARTPQVFLLGRFLVDGPDDIAEVSAIAADASLQPLSSFTGDEAAPAPPPLGEPAGPAQLVPADATFFDELGVALAVNPPASDADAAIFDAARERLGIGVPDGAGSASTDLLDDAAEAGNADIAEGARQSDARIDGWRMNNDVGRYGDDRRLRAVAARVGWGANVPEEAIYPTALTDGDGDDLDGARTYRVRFEADELPPVDAFWSLTAYGEDRFFVEHPSGRYTIGDRTDGLVYGDDGSLEVTLSHEDPGPDANWLPVPSGPFVVMLRLYLPDEPVRDGSWTPPPIERTGR